MDPQSQPTPNPPVMTPPAPPEVVQPVVSPVASVPQPATPVIQSPVAATPTSAAAPVIPAELSQPGSKGGLALIAMTLGVLAIFGSIIASTQLQFIWFVVPLCAVAIGTAIPGLGSSRRGMAIAGLILGSLALISIVVLYIVGASVKRQCQTVGDYSESNPQCQQFKTESINE